MLILKQSHYIAISFLTAAAASTIPIALLCCIPQASGYAITKLASKALKESKISFEVTHAIKAGLLTLLSASVIVGFILLGPFLGTVFGISLAATYLINQKELDKASEFNKFVNKTI